MKNLIKTRQLILEWETLNYALIGYRNACNVVTDEDFKKQLLDHINEKCDEWCVNARLLLIDWAKFSVYKDDESIKFLDCYIDSLNMFDFVDLRKVLDF